MTNGAEHRARRVYEGMREELTVMEERRDTLRVEYVTMVRDCAAMKRAMEAMERRVVCGGQGSQSAAAAPASAGVISFDGCQNTHARLVRIAESWGGRVNCHDAADLLADTGIGRGARGNLVSTLQKEMSGREDLWEYVGARTYRYLPYHRNGHVGGTGAGTGPE